jgi:hypothetical protein
MTAALPGLSGDHTWARRQPPINNHSINQLVNRTMVFPAGNKQPLVGALNYYNVNLSTLPYIFGNLPLLLTIYVTYAYFYNIFVYAIIITY